MKHLNPRQGITTNTTTQKAQDLVSKGLVCETPKSPPGDYNLTNPFPEDEVEMVKCETPKSPPGDYN